MDDTQSQNKEILAWLKAGNTITALQALRKFGCLRLSARIFNLKDQGHEIDGRMITLDNGKRVKEYYLKGSNPQTQMGL